VNHFRLVVVVDFEYEVTDGDLPNVLCMVAYVLDEHLRYLRTIRTWRGEFGARPPFDTGLNTLVVAYAAWAELQCFMVLGWPFPTHVLDLHTTFLATSNILRPYNPDETYKKPRKGLSNACCAYGIDGWEAIDKPTIAKDIGEGRWQRYGKDGVFDYCEEDVKDSAKLLRRQIRGYGRFAPIDVERVLHWSCYSGRAVAEIQARGMCINMHLWNAVQANKAAVIGHLCRRFDPSYGSEDPIFDAAGSWSYARFERWLISVGVVAWPRLDSGALDVSSDAFKLMSHVAGVAGIHALRDSLRVIANAKLPIGRDGRNRPSLFPFGTATGRNAHARSLFNAHAGMRSFMVAPPDRILVYLDWRTQEIGVVASLSGDQALMDAYRGGDVYHAFALSAGVTREPDRHHWKKHNPAERQRMKSLTLAINYGMSVPSLARGLDRHPLVAGELIERLRRSYPTFWEWREQQVGNAIMSRRMESVFGWPLHISTSPNKRTLYNFPAQAGGAEMLRLAAVRLCEIGLVPSMLVHDGILLEVEDEAQIAEAADVMHWAGREVCNGFEIGVDVDQKLLPGETYRDKREDAQEMWATVMAALQSVGINTRRLESGELRNAKRATHRGGGHRDGRRHAPSAAEVRDVCPGAPGVGSQGGQGDQHQKGPGLDRAAVRGVAGQVRDGHAVNGAARRLPPDEVPGPARA
jgi:DNA polymerase I